MSKKPAEDSSSLVWLVGVDFSMLLLGVAIIFAAIRLKPGDDQSRVDDIAQLTISNNLGRCYLITYSVEPKQGARSIFQVPDKFGSSRATDSCFVGLDNVDKTRADFYCKIVFDPNCDDVNQTLPRVLSFISQYYADPKKVWAGESIQTFLAKYQALADKRINMPNGSNKSPEDPNIKFFFDKFIESAKSDGGLGLSGNTWMYACLAHVKKRYDSVYQAPLGFRGSACRTTSDALLKFERDLEVWLNGESAINPALNVQFTDLLADQNAKKDPLMFVLAIDYAAALKPPGKFGFKIESRSTGDSTADPSSNGTTTSCGIQEKQKFLNVFLDQRVKFATVYFNNRSPSKIVWHSQLDESPCNW